MTVEVCLVLPKFKLTLVQVKVLPGTEHKQGTQQTRHRADGADLCAYGQGDLAYVLHTSGTTGLPKTVRVPHKCILPNILHLRSVMIQTVLFCLFLKVHLVNYTPLSDRCFR